MKGIVVIQPTFTTRCCHVARSRKNPLQTEGDPDRIEIYNFERPGEAFR